VAAVLRVAEEVAAMSSDALRDALAPFVGRWEICHDGSTWEHDFDLTYARG
jgi:hypothetical protein